jgi:hypothetical protein
MTLLPDSPIVTHSFQCVSLRDVMLNYYITEAYDTEAYDALSPPAQVRRVLGVLPPQLETRPTC